MAPTKCSGGDGCRNSAPSIPGRAKIRAAVQGEGPLVIMVHGFPESWYSWRHQIGPIADAGLPGRGAGRPRLRRLGQAGSDRGLQHGSADRRRRRGGRGAGPRRQGDPDRSRLGRAHRLEHGADPAGRDPRRRGPVGALHRRADRPFTEIFTEAFTSKGIFFYQAWFQNVGPPEAEAEADVRGFLRKFYYGICGDAPDGTWPHEEAWRQPAGRHGRSRPVPGLADRRRTWTTTSPSSSTPGSAGRSAAIATTSATSPGCSTSRIARSSSRRCSSAATATRRSTASAGSPTRRR